LVPLGSLQCSPGLIAGFRGRVEEEDREGQVGKERDDAGRVGGGTGLGKGYDLDS